MFSLSKKFILSCHCWINPISFLTGPINPVWIVIRIGRIIFDGINVSAYSASNFKIGCFIKKSMPPYMSTDFRASCPCHIRGRSSHRVSASRGCCCKHSRSFSLIGIFTPKTTRYSGSINKSCNKATTPDAKNGNDPVFSPRKIQGKITGKLLYCLSKPDIMALKARKLHGTLCTAFYGNASDDETGG